jgi:Type VII secretion system ESX-1, transport TM domain B
VTTSSVQVQAYRFGLRRLDSAVLDGDPLPDRDPNRATRAALCVGLAVTALLVAAVAIWGHLHP